MCWLSRVAIFFFEDLWSRYEKQTSLALVRNHLKLQISAVTRLERYKLSLASCIIVNTLLSIPKPT